MYYYSIHDIVTLRSTFQLLGVPRTFLCEKIGNPDVTVTVSDVEYDASERTMAGTARYWDEEEKSLVFDWGLAGPVNPAAELRTLSGDARITVSSAFVRWGNFSELLQSVLTYRLLLQNATFVHAAGLRDRTGRGILIQGIGGMGKTSVALSLTVDSGYHLLGDEYVILSGSEMYSLPLNIDLSPGTRIPAGTLTARERVERKIRAAYSKVPLYWLHPAAPTDGIEIELERVTEAVPPNVEVDVCYFLDPTESRPGGLSRLGSETGRQKTVKTAISTGLRSRIIFSRTITFTWTRPYPPKP